MVAPPPAAKLAGRRPHAVGRDVAAADADAAATPRPWASTGSRSWATRAAPPTPWPAARRCPTGSSPWSRGRLAPYGADGLDVFAGMADAGVASLRAAAEGHGPVRGDLPACSALEFDVVRLVLAGVIALVGYAVARGSGASRGRSMVYATAILLVATVVAVVKNVLAGH